MVKTLLRDETFLAGVLPEKEIEQDAHHGQEDQHEHPCHRLRRLTTVEQHGHHCTNNDDTVEQDSYPMDVIHNSEFTFDLRPLNHDVTTEPARQQITDVLHAFILAHHLHHLFNIVVQG